MTTIYIDVETLPGQTEEAKSKARRDTHAPAAMKRPETIAAWWRDEGDAAVDAKWRAQALDPASGELCCIGFALDDADPEAVVRELGEPEGAYLRRALAVIDARLKAHEQAIDEAMRPWVSGEPAYCVGHNVAFDLGFIRARCWATRTPIPSWIPGAFARTPRDFGDSMLAFAGYGGKISLDRLSRALELRSPKEGGFDGSQVLDAWIAGEHERIAKYCARDVASTRECWQVMAGHYTEQEVAA